MIVVIIIAAIILVLFGCIVFLGAPYVPAKMPGVRRAFEEVYVLQKDDLLLDLGAGDGRIVREAARRGARGVGYELNPVLVAVATILGRRQPRATVKVADMWTSQFPDATTIVYVFVVSRDAKRLVRKVQKEATRLGRTLYILSFAFELDAPLVRRDALHFLYEIRPFTQKKHKV